MVEQRNYLAEALAALRDAEHSPRERLRRSGALFWNAYVREGTRWPPDVTEQAGQLLAALLRRPPIRKTIEEMDDAAVARALAELERLIQSAQETL
jgi:hypothetical protein